GGGELHPFGRAGGPAGGDHDGHVGRDTHTAGVGPYAVAGHDVSGAQGGESGVDGGRGEGGGERQHGGTRAVGAVESDMQGVGQGGAGRKQQGVQGPLASGDGRRG